MQSGGARDRTVDHLISGCPALPPNSRHCYSFDAVLFVFPVLFCGSPLVYLAFLLPALFSHLFLVMAPVPDLFQLASSSSSDSLVSLSVHYVYDCPACVCVFFCS